MVLEGTFINFVTMSAVRPCLATEASDDLEAMNLAVQLRAGTFLPRSHGAHSRPAKNSFPASTRLDSRDS